MAGQRLPQQLRAKRTREQLLAAARRVFAKEGYERATVDDVARAAGCSKGAYYFHFASKEEALVALVNEWTRSQTQRLQKEAKSSRSPQAALLALLEALFAVDGGERWLLLEFWAQGRRNPKVGKRMSGCYRAWRKLLTSAFRRAQLAGAFPSGTSAEAASEAVLVLHQGLMVQACLGEPYETLAREATSAMRRLVAGTGPLRKTG